MSISRDDRDRLVKLLGMVGSAHDGEALNAARMAQTLLTRLQTTWAEVFAGEPGRDRYTQGYQDGYAKGLAAGRVKTKPVTWLALAKTLQADYDDDLTPWEQNFVDSFIDRGWASPSVKQQAIFERIADRLDLPTPET